MTMHSARMLSAPRRTLPVSLVAAAALSAALAIPSAALAYRTAADQGGFDDTERVRWHGESMHFELSAWLPPELDGVAVEQAVTAAFETWSSVACAYIETVWDGVTTASAVPGDGRVTIQWISHSWVALGFDATAAASTDVYYQQDAGGVWRVLDADIYLNAETFTWTTSGADPDARDVQTVITHEVGHSLGILHPCEIDGIDGAPVCDASHLGLTMHPLYFGIEQRTLEDDDIAAVCFLYEPDACIAEGCPEGLVCTFDGCATTCDGAVCAVGDRCGPVGCTSEPCQPGSCERGCASTCDSLGGADGDPCANDLECYSGHCSGLGYCTPSCVDGACPAGFTCDLSTTVSECRPYGGVLGAACTRADECLSGYCLVEEGVASICTRPCGERFLDCPVSFECTEVENVDVCALPNVASGCSVARRPGGAARWVALVAVLCLLAVRRKGRWSTVIGPLITGRNV